MTSGCSLKQVAQRHDKFIDAIRFVEDGHAFVRKIGGDAVAKAGENENREFAQGRELGDGRAGMIPVGDKQVGRIIAHEVEGRVAMFEGFDLGRGIMPANQHFQKREKMRVVIEHDDTRRFPVFHAASVCGGVRLRQVNIHIHPRSNGYAIGYRARLEAGGPLRTGTSVHFEAGCDLS